MSVERMKYVNIVGPVSQFDHFVLNYVIDRDIQLEHSISSMYNIRGLKPFMEENPYESLLKKLENINKVMKVHVTVCCKNELCMFSKKPLNMESTIDQLEKLEERLNRYDSEIEGMKSKITEDQQILKQLIPIRELQFDINELFNLEYMKFRFGKLPLESYKKMDMVLEGLDVIVVPFSTDEEDVWVSYFMPSLISEKIDSVMSSLYFERVRISDQAKGFPSNAIQTMEQEIKQLEEKAAEKQMQYEKVILGEMGEFQKIYNRAMYMHQAFDVRKYSAHTQEAFYITGWMTEKAYRELSGELKERDDITFSAEDPDEVRGMKPPTILKNNRFFKPFETIVRMYGIPAHNEFDPTVLVALTYILMFGAMFGDVGQGAILALAGLVMYFYKKSSLGWVLTCVGIASIIFGFLYGSLFGNEHIFHPVWKAPMDNINQLLLISIIYGAIIILVSMIINIVNSIKAKDYGRLIFDKNGLAGLVFYGGALGVVVYRFMVGDVGVSMPLILILLAIPLMLMLFREKLEKVLLKHNRNHEGGSFIEGFFEVFEAVLGFLSNTISFVRVSAFALSHAGLALAIWTLYEMVNGTGKIIVLIAGNILIIGLEGLIVGIQCLRLQYYEMFSRFFSGDGRDFNPIRICSKNEG